MNKLYKEDYQSNSQLGRRHHPGQINMTEMSSLGPPTHGIQEFERDNSPELSDPPPGERSRTGQMNTVFNNNGPEILKFRNRRNEKEAVSKKIDGFLKDSEFSSSKRSLRVKNTVHQQASPSPLSFQMRGITGRNSSTPGSVLPRNLEGGLDQP